MSAARRLVAVVALSTAACSGESVVGVVRGDGTGQCVQAPEPVGSVDETTCMTTDVALCGWECRDTAGHAFGVECDHRSCECTYDGATRCVCTVEGLGSICTGALEACCPPPWVAP